MVLNSRFYLATQPSRILTNFKKEPPEPKANNHPLSLPKQQQRPDLPRLLQQMHAQQIPGAHGAPPMPVGMPHPSLGPGGLGGPLGALGSTPPQHPLAILNKQELHRPEESKSSNSNIMPLDDRHVRSNPSIA